MGIVNIVGIGPGNDDNITPAALNAIQQSDHVIGYTTYIRLIKKHIEGKEITRTGMSEEIGRARTAIEMAKEGKTISLISSGDAGVYGMAGLVFEVLKEMNWKKGEDPEIRFFPGITASVSCGSLVGAPLIHDSCTISLSDLLTPWTVIEKRIETAAQGDFVISFYNPASGRRQRQIVEAQRILKKYRAGSTPVALVKSGYRKKQHIVMSDLDNFLEYEIGMLTTVIVGSTQTYLYEGYMVTPRGYSNKYEMESGKVKEGQRKTFSLRHDGDMNSRLEDIKKIEGEDFKLAKTYVTPTDSWVTPKDVNDKSFATNAKPKHVQSALKALEILKKPVLKKEKPVSSLKLESFSTLGLLEGALILNSKDKLFLIGEFKTPCNLDDWGLEVLEVYKEGKIRELKKKDHYKEIEMNYLCTGEGIELAFNLYEKMAIKRNNSISTRLRKLIEDKSQRVEVNNQEYFDIRWLCLNPVGVWEMIREEVLKC
ncbi:MAG: precorrin-3B C(17)-methyltransferase [Bacteriovoracaceae bacterium]